jgi:hypothetical protein
VLHASLCELQWLQCVVLTVCTVCVHSVAPLRNPTKQRFLGFKTPYSAADVVYYCTALIEHRPSDAVMAAGRAIAQQQQQQQSLAGAAAAATAAPQGGAQLAAAEVQAARDEKDAWLDRCAQFNNSNIQKAVSVGACCIVVTVLHNTLCSLSQVVLNTPGTVHKS